MGYECPACRLLCADIAGTPVDGDCHDILDEYAVGDMTEEELCEELSAEFGADCTDLALPIVSEDINIQA